MKPSRRLALAALLLLAVCSPAGALMRFEAGDRLKAFTLKAVDGSELAIPAALGPRATVVIFWAMWSPRSAEALSDLELLHRRYGSDKLRVIGVNVEHEKWDPATGAELRSYLSGAGITFPVLIDDGLNVADAYGLTAVPSLLLAGPDGKTTEVLQGYPELQREDFLRCVLEQLGIFIGPDGTTPSSNRAPAQEKVGAAPQAG